MDFKEHCYLCDNIKASLEEGIKCGLTNQKPSFNKACSSIELNDKFEEKLRAVNLVVEQIKRKEKSIRNTFYSYLAIAIILVLGGHFLFKVTFVSLYSLKITLFIMTLGLIFWSIGYGKLKHHKKELKNALYEKSKIDDVLDKYLIKYDCIITFEKKPHGSLVAIVELNFSRGLLRNSKTIYKI